MNIFKATPHARSNKKCAEPEEDDQILNLLIAALSQRDDGRLADPDVAPQQISVSAARLVRQAAASLHASGLLLRQAAVETFDPFYARHLLTLAGSAKKAAEPLRQLGRRLEVRESA